MYRRVSRAIRRWEGLSTDIRPTHDSIVVIGALLHELDTGNNFQWDGDEWVQYESSFLKIKSYLLNTETWEWEAATKGTGVGDEVSVTNFPAVISGASVPVSGIVDLGLTLQYTLRLMEDSVNPDTISYVGEAVVGSIPSVAVWRIKRLDTTIGMVVTWAGGVNTFTQIWNNRENLSYS